MRKLLKAYSGTSLIIRIVVGLCLGVILALVVPHWYAVGLLGSTFVGALKAVAPILVAVLVTSSVAKAGIGLGPRFRTVISLYAISTLAAAVTAVIASFLFPTILNIQAGEEVAYAPGNLREVFENILSNIVDNPLRSLAEGNYLGILFWSVILGLALKKSRAQRAISAAGELSDAVSKLVHWIIECAPFGILGIVFTAVSTSGLSIFTTYGHLLVVLVGCMLFVALVLNPLIVFIFTGRNPYPLVLKCLYRSGVNAFFTRSSAANIPVNMELCRDLQLDRDFYSVSIPLGSTVNMSGAAVTITVITLSVCASLGIAVDVPTAILLSVISALGACGSSGVAGGSLLLIPMACSLFGIDQSIAMAAVGIGFVIGVVQDSMETALNSSSDVVFTATAEYFSQRKAKKA